MKKFMAIVMCLAMALSMMTVVSFAASLEIGATEAYTVAPGASVSIPVYITDAGNEIFLGITQITIKAPEGVTYEVTGGVIPASGISDDGSEIVLYDDAGKTFNATSPAATIVVTAPAEVGTYTFAFEGTQELFDEAYDQIFDVAFTDIVINVEAEEVEPSIGAVDTTVPSANEGGVLKVLELIGNPTEFGIKYVGENADYAGTEFPGKIEAETSATYSAVEVIGLDDAFEAYAR